MVIAVQQLSGLLTLLLGLSFLINAGLWRRFARRLLEDPSRAVPLALLLLVTGLLIVIYHNLWLASWVIAITLIGWLFLLKAASFLLLPGLVQLFRGLSDAALQSLIYCKGILMSALGAFICYNLFLG